MRIRDWLVALTLVIIPSVASSQNPQTRSGFGISVGIGGGSGAITCDGCDSDRETGPSGYLRLGGYVRPHVFIGFETNGFIKTLDGYDITGGFYQAVAQWYPTPANGFFLKGGIGLMSYIETDGVDEFTASALGMGVGLGYDARVGRNFSLTPYANLLFSGKGDIKVNSFSSGFEASFNLIQVGLALTWH